MICTKHGDQEGTLCIFCNPLPVITYRDPIYLRDVYDKLDEILTVLKALNEKKE